MSKLTQSEIRNTARTIIARRPGGIRYSELVTEISGQSPDTPVNTIHGSLWDLATRFPNEIIKPSRGLFQPLSAQTASSDAATVTAPETVARFPEDAFYVTIRTIIQ